MLRALWRIHGSLHRKRKRDSESQATGRRHYPGSRRSRLTGKPPWGFGRPQMWGDVADMKVATNDPNPVLQPR